jgi:hypothetical protein
MPAVLIAAEVRDQARPAASPPAIASRHTQQALGRGWVVGGKDDQAGHPLLKREYLLSGSGELAPVADAGK